MSRLSDLSYSLSGYDIIRFFPKNDQPNIFSYQDIWNYSNVVDLLGKSRKCVILYKTSPNYGHWCCLYRPERNGHIFFFDSYGYKPDDELKWVQTHDEREKLQQHYHYLTKLLSEASDGGIPIEYNEYRLQEQKPGISTCGRWCVIRLKYWDIGVSDFYTLMTQHRKVISPDRLVVELTKK